MATRMQQRRGTAAQWISTNNGDGPILNAGEIGFETDTGKFKIGDGTNHWVDLAYFADVDNLGSALDGDFVELVDIGAASGVAGLDANKNVIVPGSSVIIEGSTDNAYEITIEATDPTADRTITLPDATGTIALTDSPTFTGTVTMSGDLVVNGTTTTINSTEVNVTNSFVFEGSIPDAFETTLTVAEPTADRTITLPDATGTVAMVAQLNNYVLISSKGDANGVAELDSGGQVPLSQMSPDVALTSDVSTAQTAAQSYADTAISSHNLDTTSVHGITDTSLLVTTTGNQTLTGKTISAADNDVTINAADITDVTASAAELNILDGVTSSTAELNLLDGVTATTAELNILSGVTSTTAELNILDGVIASTAEINTLSGITASSSEINILDGATLSTTELNYVDGVTSAIQTQLDAKLDLSGGTMTGALTLSGNPVNANDAANKAYVDAVTEGLHIHPSCVAGTTANIDLSTDLEAGDTIDGVTLVAGDRVLVKDQTNTAENGIYVASTTGAASRATDFDTPTEIDGGDFVFIHGGSTQGDTGWVQINTVGTVGTDAIAFTQFAGAGTYTAGTGLSLNGTVFSINESVTAKLDNPTFTGTVTLPSTTSIGTVSSTEIGYLDGVTSSVQTQLNSKTPEIYTFTTVAGAATISSSSHKYGSLKVTSGSAVNITVPTDAADAGWAIGDYVEIYQYGAGQITISHAGVTVNSTDGNKKTRVQYSSVTLIKMGANEWLLLGDTAA